MDPSAWLQLVYSRMLDLTRNMDDYSTSVRFGSERRIVEESVVCLATAKKPIGNPNCPTANQHREAQEDEELFLAGEEEHRQQNLLRR